MWVLYQHQTTKSQKKFQYKKEDKPSRLREEIPGDGAFCWKLIDPGFPLQQEAVSADPANVEEMELIGTAILINDPISGLRMWATYNGSGGNHTNLSQEQPLIIPVRGKLDGKVLELGTKVNLYVPKK